MTSTYTDAATAFPGTAVLAALVLALAVLAPIIGAEILDRRR